MKLTRRQLLQGSVAGGAAIVVGGCARSISEFSSRATPLDFTPVPRMGNDLSRIAHRIGFGPSPGDLQVLDTIGREAYLRMQLSADLPEPLVLQAQLRRVEVLGFGAEDSRDLPEDEVLRQLQQAAILRSVYNPNQLLERMVDFWSNHFNIYGRKGLAAYRLGTDSTTVIRRHALGNFHDLLSASAHSPAMLAYLDNQLNRKGVANENYARELLELHTMGVDSGYTLKDVQEVARCFTGWTIERRFLRRRGTFLFDESRHDSLSKIVLGKRIPTGGGESDGLTVLKLLAFHPATAKFISGKLCDYFVGNASTRLRAQASDAFLKSRGDIRATLLPILSLDELVSANSIIKRPFDFVISALRALGAQTDGSSALQQHLEHMGQPLHQWPMPDGYPSKPSSWTGSLLARWNFASALCEGRIEGTVIPIKEIKNSAQSARSCVWGLPTEREAITTQSLAIELSAPEFQWR